MKKVFYASGNQIEVREVEEPHPGPGQVKIKTAYAALCATDVHMVTMGVLGAKPGIPLGHEASGTIVELGEHTQEYGFRVGDKVVTAPTSVCGKCPMCKKGMPQYCDNAVPIGAFSEYMVTDISAVYQIPKNADMQKYALTEPAVCTVRAMDLAGIRHGDTVLVSGVGGIGSILLSMIALSGASRITAVDPVPEKRQLARELGASYVVDPFRENVQKTAQEITEGQGFDHVFEVSGVPSAADVCLEVVGHCGKVTYFAVFPPDYEMSLNLYQLYMKEASIQTVFTSHPIFPRAIRLMERIHTEKIVGKVMPLERAVEAFELFHKSIYPKILLKC